MIDDSELLFVVDENNKPTKALPRDKVHKRRLWHRTADIWFINSNDQFLCHVRSNKKDNNPEKIDARFGGHLNPGQSYLLGAVSEVEEEIGLRTNKKKLIDLGIFKSDAHRVFTSQFLCIWNGDILKLKLEEDEIEKVMWVKKEEVYRAYQNNNSKYAITGEELDIIKVIKKHID